MSKAIRTLLHFILFTLLLSFALHEAHAAAAGPVSSKQARDAIRHLGGSELSKGSVKVMSVSPSGDGGADVLARVKLAFRLTRDDRERWSVEEVRTGDRRWEDVGMILSAAGTASTVDEEGAIENVLGELSPEQARTLIAQLFGVRLPSNTVRVNAVSPLGNSASVETQIELEFHLVRDAGAWRVQKIRTAGNNWVEVDPVIASMNQQKIARAREEMREVAQALAAFRSERGFYVEAMDEGALVDHLSPQYLKRVIRYDPWNRPYLYTGTRASYTLRSAGADGKPETADDIVVSSGQ